MKYDYCIKYCRICNQEFKPSSGVQQVCFNQDCRYQIKLEKWRRKNQIHKERIYSDNLKRYYRKKEYFKNNQEKVECKCGCKTLIPKYTSKGKLNYLVKGHYWKGRKMPDWVCEKWRERQLKLMHDTSYIKMRLDFLHSRPNKLESRVISIIKENNIDLRYVGNGEFFIGRFNPDFINIEKKKVVEVFGSYWHNLDKAIEKDKHRLETYQKEGYDLLVLWENKIKNEDDFYITSLLQKFLMNELEVMKSS